MPRAALRPCRRAGCRELVRRGWCAAHRPEPFRLTDEQRREYDRRRGTAAQRGYDARWTRLRNQVLAEEPLCRSCRAAGRLTPAELVDHVEPIWRAPELRLVRSNLQPLCRACHERKTRRDGSYRRRDARPVPAGPRPGGARGGSRRA